VRLLLDAHTLIWAVDDPSKLGPLAVLAFQDESNELFISAGTIWEVAIKTGLGKLNLSMPVGDWLNKAIADLGARILPITVDHAAAQSRLAGRGDPFDRLLAAQSMIEKMTVASNDVALDQHGVHRLW
jgi:PIN domain nuclease of toxin-antitoxin system